MKYQSELIKEMIDSRGHEKSSIHYQSECVETWIEEAKGAYPKLCDYESEWLNYIVQNPIGEFPYETVSTNTTATVNNVVPYAYKSAILKGNTKYQIGEFIQDVQAHVQQFKVGYYIDYVDGTLRQGGEELRYCEDYIPIPTGVTSITSKGSSCWKKLCCYDSDKNFISGVNGTEGLDDLTLNIPSNAKYFRYSTNTTNGENEYINVVSNNGLLLASSNYNIPCELVSVKLPVLTTTGKNLFDLTGKVISSGNNLHQIQNNEVIMENTTYGYYSCRIQYFNLKPNERYIFSYNSEVLSGTPYERVMIQDENRNTLDDETRAFTAPLNGKIQILFYCGSANKMGKIRYYNIQIEEGTVVTSYETFKSNILTVNEEVELRGIGEGSNRVEDELNLLTGELTERIDEIVLDGSEDEGWGITSANGMVTRFSSAPNTLPFAIDGWTNKITIICDKLISTHNNGWHGKTNHIYQGGNKNIFITKVEGTTLDEFKEWLSQNPITVQYQLATESVKTVDLSVTDQDGNTLNKIKPIEGTMHITPTGEPIAPTAVLEVPVEAVTQNLASFIKGE